MAFKTLLNEVEFLTEYPMIGLAIANTTGPVPGYLFGEINAMTYIDNGSNCKMLVSFLVSRLKSDVPLVCIKILKLLLHLVKNGHSEIVNEVKLHEVTIKEARSFNGPADDVYGHSFYETIRNMAKELLDIVFSENAENAERTSIAENASLSGYGSQASSKKMAGFGYSVKTEKSVSEVVSDSFTSFMETLFPSQDKEAEPISHIGDALPKYKPIVIERDPGIRDMAAKLESPGYGFFAPVNKYVRMKVHRPGRAGGGWESSSDEDEDEDNGTPPLIVELSKGISVESLESSKAFVECTSEISEESKIVNEFVTDKPLHELSCEYVKEICKRCSSLNCEEILCLTLEKLDIKHEEIQRRALVFIEYLLFYDVVTVDSLMKALPHFTEFLADNEGGPISVLIKSEKIHTTITKLAEKTMIKKANQQEPSFSAETEIVKS